MGSLNKLPRVRKVPGRKGGKMQVTLIGFVGEKELVKVSGGGWCDEWDEFRLGGEEGEVVKINHAEAEAAVRQGSIEEGRKFVAAEERRRKEESKREGERHERLREEFKGLLRTIPQEERSIQALWQAAKEVWER